MTFEEALAFGQDGEHIVAGLLLGRGVAVQPLYQHDDDHAPFLLYATDGDAARAVLPDLTCWHGRRQFFAEVKRKRRWVLWDGRRETGCNQRLLDEYQHVKLITGAPVYLFFVHENDPPVGIFFGELGTLSATVRLWDGRSPSGKYIEPPLALFDAELLRELNP